MATVHVVPFDKAVAAAESDSYLLNAEEYLEDLGNKAVSLLSDELKPYPQKREEIESLLFAEVDFELVSKYVLGQYWKHVRHGQRPEYHDLFRRLEIDTLSRRLLKYQVQGFEITGAEQRGSEDILIHTTIFRLNAEPFLPTWRIRRSNGAFRIVDLHYDGISLAKTRRGEFMSILKDQGFEGLIAQLRQNSLKLNQQ